MRKYLSKRNETQNLKQQWNGTNDDNTVVLQNTCVGMLGHYTQLLYGQLAFPYNVFACESGVCNLLHLPFVPLICRLHVLNFLYLNLSFAKIDVILSFSSFTLRVNFISSTAIFETSETDLIIASKDSFSKKHFIMNGSVPSLDIQH